MISEEEPIYCEIPSPCKGPTTTTTASSALQLRRGQPLRSSNSRLIQGIQPAQAQGLGRRAITQLDMSPPKRPAARIIPNSSRDADKTAIRVFFLLPIMLVAKLLSSPSSIF